MDKIATKFYTQLVEADQLQQLVSCLLLASFHITEAELIQVYLLDQSKTKLYLYGQLLNNKTILKEDTVHDYYNDELLQYSLIRNKTILSKDINSLLLAENFLPAAGSKQWRSLLIQPILNKKQHICGLLVAASVKSADWQDQIGTLAHFGLLMLIQYDRLVALQIKEEATLTADKKVIKPVATEQGYYGLIGSSKAMANVHLLISKVLHTPYTVLITGETGTGKELVAKAIHNFSCRKNNPFIVQNCASMPETLLESELFGYCKGAFTGADKDYLGLFREANGGTLFLDEIGDMPLMLQAKLLRVLQEGEVKPLGSSKTYKVDVRIVAATHRDLFEEITKGTFREDLYYRLAKFPIELPSLRMRGNDLLELADFFIEKTCQFLDRKKCTMTKGFREKLLAYSFPGNVRELKGLLERAILLADDDVLKEENLQLTKLNKAVNSDNNYKASLANYEREHLLKSLQFNQGNQTKTAKQLGMSRRTLIYKLQKFNITKEDILV